eukprot:CAMPEP_0176128972 /NCGR_PEP_ID=MMETSP0120_2-20121206/65192_1 /TAXON_ID=160619 /ORGANISM="Kryptoperidinium foliaceum, Strain CCMP 1326" /LENGTH=50 /DNA_ID=CAMNT_0017464117 /DNA_START=84 /DNA_END=232 /DNA_ORIENTATION=-
MTPGMAEDPEKDRPPKEDGVAVLHMREEVAMLPKPPSACCEGALRPPNRG